jgi:hypothetical protein
MARIAVEDKWWTDPRRSRLVKLLGGEDEVEGAVLKMWRLAQEFWKHGKGLVPQELFMTLLHADELIESGLASVQDSFIYVRGSSMYLDWVREQREHASEAGKKSADARRKKSGTAQPKAPERLPNDSRTESNDAEPSVSVSVSVLDSVLGSNAAAEDVFQELQQKATPIPIGRKPPPGYEAFADQQDPEKQKLIENSASVIEALLQTKASPRVRKLLPRMLRAVAWDVTEFCVLAARLQTQFDDRESRGMPTPLAYREVAIQREFGLLESGS